MSEMPERKVLKKVLAKLKSKTLSSNEMRKQQATLAIKEMDIAMQELSKRIKKGPDVLNLWLMNLFQIIKSLVEKLVLTSDTASSDMESYIDALERYSINLDKTLWDAIEQAKKEAEEQIKKQEELMKKKSPESYRI